jgi:hypothetical protein
MWGRGLRGEMEPRQEVARQRRVARRATGSDCTAPNPRMKNSQAGWGEDLGEGICAAICRTFCARVWFCHKVWQKGLFVDEHRGL